MRIVSDQSFKLILVNNTEMTNQHFKTDAAAVDHGYSYQQAEYQGKQSNGANNGVVEQKRKEDKEKDRQRRRERQAQAASGAIDEDEEIRRAIELSKETAKKEEKQRVKEVLTTSKAQPQNSSPAKAEDEFNFGSGFEKFSTNNKPVQGDNVNDFDFGSDVIQPKGAQKQEGEFDFNFNGGGAAPQKKEVPQSSGGGMDLMDLLGGVDMNAQPEPQAP